MKTSSETLRDLLDIPVTLSPAEARELANKNALPKNAVVTGNLDLRFSHLEKLPPNLCVKGNIDINYSKITSLPKDLIIEGQVFCLFDDIEHSLPRSKIRNCFVREGNTAVCTSTAFETLFNEMGITGLPDMPIHVKCGNDPDYDPTTIDLNLTKAELPDNLTITGRVFFTSKNEKIKIPNNLKIDGSLTIWGPTLESLPSDITVTKYITAKHKEFPLPPGVKEIREFRTVKFSEMDKILAME